MNIIFIGISGLMLFFGQGYLQLLVLVFLSDTVEYGHYKFQKRNESVSFSVQPFINKLAGAIASGVVLVTAIVSGMNDANSSADMSTSGIQLIKIMMMIVPLLLIIASFYIYLKFYKINDKYYKEIIDTIKSREK